MVFCASSRITKALSSVRLRIKASGAIRPIRFQDTDSVYPAVSSSASKAAAYRVKFFAHVARQNQRFSPVSTAGPVNTMRFTSLFSVPAQPVLRLYRFYQCLPDQLQKAYRVFLWLPPYAAGWRFAFIIRPLLPNKQNEVVVERFFFAFSMFSPVCPSSLSITVSVSSPVLW